MPTLIRKIKTQNPKSNTQKPQTEAPIKPQTHQNSENPTFKKIQPTSQIKPPNPKKHHKI